MSKMLPFVFPPVTSYPAVAYVLSIIYHDVENTAPWLCNNYIQLAAFWGKERRDTLYGSFYEEITPYHTPIQFSCPYIYCEVINRYTGDISADRVIDYVKEMIDSGHYIEIFVDQFYLSVSSAYNMFHKKHPIFIYGYDDKAFYVADFFNGPFSNEKISYNEFLDSYAKDDETNAPFIHQCFRMFKYHKCDYPVDIELIKEYTKDYLECRDSFKKYLHINEFRNMKLFYGLDYYKALTIHLGSNVEHIDHRMFHALCDHKVLMKFRVDFLSENGHLNNYYHSQLSEMIDETSHASIVMRNLVIKYNITHNQELTRKIEKNINQLADQDEKFMKMFYASLK